MRVRPPHGPRPPPGSCRLVRDHEGAASRSRRRTATMGSTRSEIRRLARKRAAQKRAGTWGLRAPCASRRRRANKARLLPCKCHVCHLSALRLQVPSSVLNHLLTARQQEEGRYFSARCDTMQLTAQNSACHKVPGVCSELSHLLSGWALRASSVKWG